MSYFTFELIHKSKKSSARVGRIHTPHGVIDTPNFVGVGTNAALKAVDSIVVNDINLQLMFCNTYHLLLQPGIEVIKRAGGLHTFMNRHAPIITDSGGFQVFSLMYNSVKDELKGKGKKNGGDNLVIKISEEGVLFRSYRDGAKILLTPEFSVQAQKDFGADIIIPFDELPPYHIDPLALRRSFERTHRWEKRSLNTHLQDTRNQAMYSVIHGGIDSDLRKMSCKILTELPFDGHAIGGSLGKNRYEMISMLTSMMRYLPSDKPNHLLGIGDLESIESCVALGIDTFDSSHPTRCARHGLLFTAHGYVKIAQSKYAQQFTPVDASCSCYTCTHFTASYLHHLYKSGELSLYTLATIHNLHYMVTLMGQYREKIINNEI